MENEKILYGSMHWPGCEPVKEFLDKNNFKFTYVDITENMKNLKEFIKIRDTHDTYKGIRGRAMVGIPMLKIDDEVIIGLSEEKLLEIIEKYKEVE